jgi:hypothetical protein
VDTYSATGVWERQLGDNGWRGIGCETSAPALDARWVSIRPSCGSPGCRFRRAPRPQRSADPASAALVAAVHHRRSLGSPFPLNVALGQSAPASTAARLSEYPTPEKPVKSLGIAERTRLSRRFRTSRYASSSYWMSSLNAALRVRSSSAVNPRNRCDLAKIAGLGKISSLFATSGSDFSSAFREPTTGEM